MMVTVLIGVGLVLGALNGYFVNQSRRDFRRKILKDLDKPGIASSPVPYIRNILANPEGWKKSLSMVRKPFKKQINLAIETVATLVALLGLVNGLSNFDRYFKNTNEGAIVMAFIAAVLAFIPCEGFFSAQAEKDMDAFLADMARAEKERRLEAHIKSVAKTWRAEN